jgi:serine/threonine protein kinase
MNYKVIRSDGHVSTLFVDDAEKLGRGATANVYRIHFDGNDFAAKIYHQGRLFNKNKIRAMLENPPIDCEVISHGQEYPRFAWPLFIVSDRANNEVGFLMPLVDTHESFTLDHYYDLGLFRKLNSHDEAALSYKIEIAKNLSRLVADLHSHGHFFIDCKPQNIRVFKRNHVVTLIDCDGFSIKGKNKRFPAELLSTDYIAPEAQRNNTLPADLGEFQDRYALAVILFQLLNRGTHPFQGLLTDNNLSLNTNDEKAAAGLYPYGIVPNLRIKPRPQSTHHLWCEETRILFDQAFANGSPGERPSAHEWADHFESLLTTKSLVRCEKYPNDVSHMRFRNMRCSACYLKALPIFVPPTPQPSKVVPPLPTPQTANPPYMSPPAPKSSNSWVWIASIVIFVLAVWLINTGGKITPTPTQTVRPTTPSSGASTAPSTSPAPSAPSAPSVAPTQPNTASPIAALPRTKYVSLYVSPETRAVGYAIDQDYEGQANNVAEYHCRMQIKAYPKEECVKIVSGAAQCLGISRAPDGTIGASIGGSFAEVSREALSQCKTRGGNNCPDPILAKTAFCQK